jgi:DNA-binding response OmpR family regulator
MKDNKVSHAGEPTSAPARGGTNPSHRILVVDDDLCIRQLSGEVLTRSGYEVDIAEDGEAGWQALQARNYDLLITDNNMPMLSGVELIMKLRAKDIKLPVILASGAIPTAELNRHPWLQLAATLLKPFTIEELLGTVKKVLRAAESTRSRAEHYFPVLPGAVNQTELLTPGASLNERIALG